jgi:phosphatidylserine decarboxylase
MNTLFRLMTELSSRKSISRLTGTFAKSRWSRFFIPFFAKTYQIRIEDAEHPIDTYRSLNEFFTRRLKSGLRPLAENASHAISPVDGLITGMGTIEQGVMLHIKGQNYTVKELLNGHTRFDTYLHGYYIVLYLSPQDYHRIHAPVSGHILETEHVLGKVYPVNDFGLTHMRQVLSRNERLITYIKHPAGEVAVVKVGAMNVSSIKYVEPLPNQIQRGDELAYFEFGSTVVILFENNSFELASDLQIGKKVHMGQSLGSLISNVKS